MVAAIIGAIFGNVPAVWILGGLIAGISSLVGWLLLRGGRELVESGSQSELSTKTQAIIALAATRGGTVTQWDVAQALAITPQEADEILTRLAKEQIDLVKVDIDDEGRVLYRFTSLAWANMRPPPPMRVEAPKPGVRVEPGVRVPTEAEPLPLEEEREADVYGVRRAKAR